MGAIVGGGILVLAGTAFETTGPSAIVAFAINGVVALLTALSFAEMATAFPESGGAYLFAKKVLTVRAAFGVGWVLWFAYIVAGVLYALGFAEYAVAIAADCLQAAGVAPPAWLAARPVLLLLGVAATSLYAWRMVRSSSGGGQLETVGKLVLFAVLIVFGTVAVVAAPSGTVTRSMSPFFPGGASGLIAAMGFTFIALQGFDLIPAIGGEIKDPGRTIPRAMLLSLGIGLVVYLPLLFLVSTVGVHPGQTIAEMSAARPATVMADAARQFAGAFGYWMVMGAAVLSTMSALAANLLAASRVGLTMARDRTLPRVMANLHDGRGTPVMAIYASGLTLVAILLMLPDVSAAGAAASLIFLLCFTLVHWTSFLARRRSKGKRGFQAPLFPLVQVLGGGACAALALFQAVTVPSAGLIAALWLGFGAILYVALFAARAQAVDAFAEAVDPQLSVLRGRSPLVVVPVANPASAPGLVTVGSALAPPVVGRVLLLHVMRPPERDTGHVQSAIEASQAVVRRALAASLEEGHSPETLMTISADPWGEIARVAEGHGCQSLLLGMTAVKEAQVERLEELLNRVTCDTVVLSANDGWTLGAEARVIVPIGGRGGHDNLRARLLGSLGRSGLRRVTFLRILPPGTGERERRHAEHTLRTFADEETRGSPNAEVLLSDDVVSALSTVAGEGDLLVLGLQRHRGKRLFGEVALQVARQSRSATLLISHHE